MRDIAGTAGKPLEAAGRLLELGCAAGRMLRWLADLSGPCEMWGADINARHIFWCKQYLCPPFHFLLTTTAPHLPFEDRYFGFVFAGSVFTHLDDLADTWFLELRRVLRPGGCLYVTVHDKSTLRLFEDSKYDYGLTRYLRFCPEFEKFRRTDFGMFTIGRSYKRERPRSLPSGTPTSAAPTGSDCARQLPADTR